MTGMTGEVRNSLTIKKMLTLDGDVKCLACSRRNSVISVALKYIVRFTRYVAEHQLVTAADHSTLFIVVCHHTIVAVVINYLLILLLLFLYPWG